LELEYIRRTRFRIQFGAQMPNIFAFAKWVGSPIVLGTGRPTLFLHIAWIAEPEVWKLAIDEALNSNPNLQIILLYDYAMMPEKKAFELANNMWHKWNNHRISISMSPTWYKVFGDIHSGILAVFCDEKGVVRHIEPYPHLRVSPYWSEEVADWRPKLHQAVKKVLDKFFTKGQGR
ncbi:MAG: hypothetical protein RMK94_17290, partial [Armatimonadota bacterium]|nr:hypothetical protein [Armatimonadota bacterium]